MARGHTAPWCSVRLRLLGANWQEFTQVGRHPTVPHRGLLRAVRTYAVKLIAEGLPTRTSGPAGVNMPLARSTVKATMLSLSWFAA